MLDFFLALASVSESDDELLEESSVVDEAVPDLEEVESLLLLWLSEDESSLESESELLSSESESELLSSDLQS